MPWRQRSRCVLESGWRRGAGGLIGVGTSKVSHLCGLTVFAWEAERVKDQHAMVIICIRSLGAM
jgi:hypothetical protein